MELFYLLWQLCWPIFFYGLMIDLASFFLSEQGALMCTLAGASAAVPVLLQKYQERADRLQPRITHEKQQERFSRIFVWKKVFFYAMTGIAACLVANTLIMLSPLPGLFQGFSRVAEELYEPPILLQAAAMGCVIPAAEELAFRGLGFAELRESCSFMLSACLSSVFFGIYHGNIIQGIYAFCMGMVFAWAMERERTVLAPYLVHMTANLTSVVITMCWKIVH